MSRDLTIDPINGDIIPDNWKWWECPSCGDYAYIAPDGDIPKCSCSKHETTESTTKKEQIMDITKREYEILIKQCLSDISIKAAEAREHGMSYQLDVLNDIVVIIKRAQELGIKAKEAPRD